MRPYTVLYNRPSVDNLLSAFVCEADSAKSARKQCASAHPGAIPAAAYRTADAETAFARYFAQFGEG